MKTHPNLNFKFGTAYEDVAFVIRDKFGVNRYITFIYTEYFLRFVHPNGVCYSREKIIQVLN